MDEFVVGLPSYKFDLFQFDTFVAVVKAVLNPDNPQAMAEWVVLGTPFVLLILAGIYLVLKENQRTYEVAH